MSSYAVTDRLEFAPPPPPGMVRAFGLAVVAHALLVAALTWGVSWRHQAEPVTVEAELWAALPQQAAPKPVEPPAQPVETPPPPQPNEADINVERAKKPDAPPPPTEKPKPDPKLQAQRKADEEAKRLEQQRQENLQRMAGLAGATGGANASGSALQAAGPSASYAGRIKARIKPNIVFSDDVAGNPAAEVEVRTAPEGSILSRRLTHSSGVKGWDEAVLKAIDKTEVLPRDTDGRVPPVLVISFRPKD
jgi:colicin import membrane protein